jgi:hypothetical protein
MKHFQHPHETSETLKTYSCNMGFARTNGGTSARRSTAAHGPHCVAATRATRPGAASHESRPSRLLVEASIVEARQLGCGEKAARWR